MKVQYNSPGQYQLMLTAFELEVLYHSLKANIVTLATENVRLCGLLVEPESTNALSDNLAMLDQCMKLSVTLEQFAHVA